MGPHLSIFEISLTVFDRYLPLGYENCMGPQKSVIDSWAYSYNDQGYSRPYNHYLT